MDNKLSELSKPVAYDYQIAGACIADGHNENGKWVDWNNKLSRYCPPDWMVEEGKVTELKPLYSQEYVSALLEDNERVARDLVARNGEIEGLRKRAAELESIRADASQVFKEIGNELGCNPDNESIMMAIDELKEREKRVVALAGGNADLWETMAARLEAAEAKLVTPVVINLPERRDNSYDWDGAPPSEAFNICRSICGLMFRQQLRAAGLTVGDE
ncbi:hypothetical protein [Serratia sarumanii]|uniref:Ead/Ea22-like family protein n=1 Tax=Serratia sarumanii TaxID=3020826 RepID=A0ABW8QKF5_9GAMM